MSKFRNGLTALAVVATILPLGAGAAIAQIQTASTGVQPAADVTGLAQQLQQTLDTSTASAVAQKLDFDTARDQHIDAMQNTIIAGGLNPLAVQQALNIVTAATRPSRSALDALRLRVEATVMACYSEAQIAAARKGKPETQFGSCAAGLSVAATGGTPAPLFDAPNFAGVSGGADYRTGS